MTLNSDTKEIITENNKNAEMQICLITYRNLIRLNSIQKYQFSESH